MRWPLVNEVHQPTVLYVARDSSVAPAMFIAIGS